MLEPDRGEIEAFVDALFQHAGDKGFVAVRSFFEEKDKPFRLSTAKLSGGLQFLIDVAEDDARRAAQNPTPVVFAPPIAVFAGKDRAGEEDVLLGLALSVECDQHPNEARAKLEALVGPATIVVQSGGRWLNGGGKPEDKLHLHWRLAKPAQGKDDLAKLKQLRELAAQLVGGDPSCSPICHPLRWPGSWHRKAEPRLAQIVSAFETEIGLEEVLELLRDASGAAGFDTNNAGKRQHGEHCDGRLRAADPAAVVAALSVIPNDNLEWADWNKFGLAIWGATGGSDAGGKAFAAWSAKAKKNVAETTNARWQHYRTSPPSRIGFGSLVYWARHYQPGWTYAAAGSLSGANAASGAGSESTVATLNKVHAVLPIGGKTRVVTFGELEEFPGRETIVMTQTIADFKSLNNKYRHTWRDKEGELRSVPLGSYWIGSPKRRTAFLKPENGGNRFFSADAIDLQRLRDTGA